MSPDVRPGFDRPSTTFELVTRPPFGPYFWTKLFRTTGVWIQNVTSAVVAYQVSGSTLVVGLVSALQFLAPLVFTLWAGGLADRRGRIDILLIGQAISGSGATALAIWIAITGVDGLPGATPILVVALVTGIGFALTAPTMQAIVPSMVGPRDVDQAVALSSLVFNVARVIGPIIGAIALALGGPAAAYGVNVVGHVVFVSYLITLRRTSVNAATRGPSTSILDTVRIVSDNRPLRLAILVIAAFGYAADPVITLTPELSNIFGSGERGVALMVSAFGVGSVTAAGLYRRIRARVEHNRLLVMALLLKGASLAGLTMATGQGAAIAWFAVGGFAFFIGVSSVTTFIHSQIEESTRGRVMAVWTLAFLGIRPVAALANGWIGGKAGIQEALLLAALIPILAALLVRRTVVSDRRIPPSDGGPD